MADRRRTFGPVVLLGLASSALAAVASAKPWLGAPGSGGTQDAAFDALQEGAKYPVASALSLLLLASWGVLLVTRRRVRLVFAVVAALAAVGVVVSAVVAHRTMVADQGPSLAQALGQATGDVGFTGWFWTAAVSGLVALVASVLACRLVGSWPEMGTRYDAPGAAPVDDEQALESERDLWTALDEGRDPTDTGGRPDGPPR